MKKERETIHHHSNSDKKKKHKYRWVGATALAGILAIGGAGWVFSVQTKKTDDISSDEINQRTVQFNKAIKAKITLEKVKPAELFKAFTVMNLQPSAVKKLQADIQHGKTKLAWITVWDDYAEDGDIINIQAGGFNSQISLLNEKQKMAIPINQGNVTITGVADGGGGITLGFLTSTGAISLPVIAVGQTIIIPTIK